MVIDQVYVAGMPALETEYDAPVAGNADRPMTGQLALQSMQPETGQIHTCRSCRLIKTGQDTLHLCDIFRRHSSTVSFLVEKPETLVPEADNHLQIVTYHLSVYKLLLRVLVLEPGVAWASPDSLLRGMPWIQGR